MKIIAAIAFVLLVVATAFLAERRAALPAAARPAKRRMFTSAIIGAVGIGWLGYACLTIGPLWQIATAGLLAFGGFLGILISAREMWSVLKREAGRD